MNKRKIMILILAIFVVVPVNLFASMDLDIEPNTDGIISKAKIVNVVIKLQSDDQIDLKHVTIDWNRENITEQILNSAAIHFNDDKTAMSLYYPVSAADLHSGKHFICASTGNGKWWESELTIQDYGPNSLYFSFSNPVESTRTPLVSSTIQKNVSIASVDFVKPTVTKFDVQPRSVSEGASVMVTFTVQDTGGSGLKQVELWRKKDSGNWSGLQTRTLSGNGPVSGSFSDKPSPAGTYYYGIHVVDNGGNWGSEGALGVKAVTVLCSMAPAIYSAVQCDSVRSDVGTPPYPCCDNDRDNNATGSNDGNCTWYAWYAAKKKKGWTVPSNWGAGGSWCSNAANTAGWTVSSTPGKDTIACSSSLGHVTWVIAVSADQKTITVEEMNCKVPPSCVSNGGLRTKSYNASSFRYISKK